MTYIGFMCIVFGIINERRFLFPLFPFLIIFATLPVQRLVEYGLSTFSLSRKQKDVFLVIVIIIIIILSGLFTLRYDKLDPVLENEKMDFAKYALENLHGNTLRDFGGGTDYITDIVLIHNNDFRDFKIDYWTDKTERKKYEFREIGVYGESIEDLIKDIRPQKKQTIPQQQSGNMDQYFTQTNKMLESDGNFNRIMELVNFKMNPTTNMRPNLTEQIGTINTGCNKNNEFEIDILISLLVVKL